MATRRPYERVQPSIPAPFYALIQTLAEQCGEQPADLQRELLKRGLESYLRDMSVTLDLLGATDRVRDILAQSELAQGELPTEDTSDESP